MKRSAQFDIIIWVVKLKYGFHLAALFVWLEASYHPTGEQI
jgi:hypothetical protein